MAQRYILVGMLQTFGDLFFEKGLGRRKVEKVARQGLKILFF